MIFGKHNFFQEPKVGLFLHCAHTTLKYRTCLHVVISKSINNSGKVEGLKMLHLKYIYIFLKEQALINYLAKSGVCTHSSATPLVG